MKYYCETISADLSEKLKEKGMPIDIDYDTFDSGTEYQREEKWCNNTYAEAFDWFLDKHETFVYVTCLRMDEGWQYCGGIWGFGIDMTLGWKSSWHEAANAAIEKALTLI